MHTVFYHGLGLLNGETLGGIMGSVPIKSICFAKDILNTLGTDVCLYRDIHHAFRLCFITLQASEGVTL